MADPSPDRVVGTEFMSVLVSGATIQRDPEAEQEDGRGARR